MATSHFAGGTHHCEICPVKDHGATLKNFQKCELHPGHRDFMTVDEFKRKNPFENLNGWRTSIVFNTIERTTRVVVNHTSIQRPDTYANSEKSYPCIKERGSYNWTRYGTAFLVKPYSFDTREQCPCLQCKTTTHQTPNLKSYYFVIKTATHVIYDDQEAQNAVFELFYDSEDRKMVKNVYGIAVLEAEHLRLETDRCFVVCVTHDCNLAEKMNVLCDPAMSLTSTDGVLVSHPHGMSKRISVSCRPQCTLFMNVNETSIKLKKDTMLRFPGFRDDACVVQDINRLLGKRVIAFDETSKTFVLLCDLSVYRPGGIVFDIECHRYWIHTVLKTDNKLWWNISSHGTQLVTDDGKQYTIPQKDGEAPGVKIEALGHIKSFLDNDVMDKLCLFIYCRYNMASCPGSSGAHVSSIVDYVQVSEIGGVHFGDSGDYNTSSLMCVYPPRYQQEHGTNSMNMGMDEEREIFKQLFYFLITGKHYA